MAFEIDITTTRFLQVFVGMCNSLILLAELGQ